MNIPCKLFVIFAIIAISVASRSSSYGQYCGKNCDLDICKTTKCSVISEDKCKGKIRQGGGYCKCCQNCIIPLPEGSLCNPDPGYAVPEPVPYCDEGLTCDCETKRCTPCGSCAYPFQ